MSTEIRVRSNELQKLIQEAAGLQGELQAVREERDWLRAALEKATESTKPILPKKGEAALVSNILRAVHGPLSEPYRVLYFSGDDRRIEIRIQKLGALPEIMIYDEAGQFPRIEKDKDSG